MISLCGGPNGYAGIFLPAAMCAIYSPDAFTIPSHPRAYPTNALDDPRIQTKEEAEHDAKQKEYEQFAGVVNGLKILSNKKWKECGLKS